jgi:hypothetical protein
LQAFSLLLVLAGSTLLTKVDAVKKDANGIKFVPTAPPEDLTESPRISRQSYPSLYTPASNTKYQYEFVPVPAVANGEAASEHGGVAGNNVQYITHLQEHYRNLPQKQQQQILAAIRAAKQPKSPVYHATPLEPFGALLKHASGDQYKEKTVLVTPKPISEQYHGDQSGDEQEAADHAYYTGSNNAVGTHTEALIPEPKYAPLAYKSLNQNHQTLHHHDEHEEPKNVS